MAARRESPRCRTTLSAICVPMVSTGLRLVIGSWKIIAILWPRSARIASIGSVVSSWPSKQIEPPTMRPVSGAISRRIDSAVTDLPQPDSPTMPSVSPAARSKEMPSTARTMPSAVKKWVSRSRTCSRVTGASPVADRGGRAGRRPAC